MGRVNERLELPTQFFLRDDLASEFRSAIDATEIMSNALENTTASLKHRIEMLLETPWNEDGFLLGKLLNLVKILKSKTNLKPDFQVLADDLRRWNYPEQPVQRRWLRAVYNIKPDEYVKEETKDDA